MPSEHLAAVAMHRRPRLRTRLAAVLILDVVGSSRLMAMDAERTLAALRSAYRSVARPAVADNAGRVVKLMGDGLLADFDHARAGLIAAVAVQRALRAPQEPVLRRWPLRLRAGLAYGPIIEQDGDVFGETVHVAARLEAAAEPGSILTTQRTLDAAGDVREIDVAALGPTRLRNLPTPVPLCRVRPR